MTVWFAFAIYVVKASWWFLLLAAGMLGYQGLKELHAWRKMPKLTAERLESQSLISPNKAPLEISIVRKTNDYSRFVILIPIFFAFMGAMVFPWFRLGEHIDFKNWLKLTDYGFGTLFMFVGSTMTYRMVKEGNKVRRAVANPVCVFGVVTEATGDGLSYRFRDLLGGEFDGSGTEYSGDYYEEMEVPIVYERDNPRNNVPVSALYDEYEVNFKIV